MYRKQQIANILAFVFMIVMNTLANALPLGGRNTGELSALYPNLFVPAGVTFSIWGVIYLWLLGFIVYQSRGLFSADQTQINSYMHERLGYLFVINALANGSWIVVWHYEYVVLSLVVMLVLLFTLISIIRQLNTGRRAVSIGERWCVHAPFTIYLGWISIATIANFTTVLVDSGYDGMPLGEVNWTIFMLAVAT
ncbi:MAG: tryptophan-rich sensory protein, partial [Bacteroidota bacterium]